MILIQPILLSNKNIIEHRLLFVDGSYNSHQNLGYGAYLIIQMNEISSDNLEARIKVTDFSNTSSTKLELQTLIWALSDIPQNEDRITIYTDSQNILKLPERREKLELREYRTKKNRLLKNYELYKTFFNVLDGLNYELVKIKGHQPSRNKDEIDRLFSGVDKASRKALKNPEKYSSGFVK